METKIKAPQARESDVANQNLPGVAKNWLSNEELTKLVDVSKRTLYNLRSSGQLGFTKLGRKVFYNIQDVELLLSKNLNKPFKSSGHGRQ